MKWLRKRRAKKASLLKKQVQNSQEKKTPKVSSNIEDKNYQLFINGQELENRGLDLASNPYNGTVLGDVVLVAKSLLEDEAHEDDHTVALFHRTLINSSLSLS